MPAALVQTSRVENKEAQQWRATPPGPGGRGGRGGPGPAGLSHLVRGFQHLHEEGVDGRVPDELEEEEVLQALEADGA